MGKEVPLSLRERVGGEGEFLQAMPSKLHDVFPPALTLTLSRRERGLSRPLAPGSSRIDTSRPDRYPLPS